MNNKELVDIKISIENAGRLRYLVKQLRVGSFDELLDPIIDMLFVYHIFKLNSVTSNYQEAYIYYLRWIGILSDDQEIEELVRMHFKYDPFIEKGIFSIMDREFE